MNSIDHRGTKMQTILQSMKHVGLVGTVRKEIETIFSSFYQVKHLEDKIQSLAPRKVVRELGSTKEGLTLLLQSPDGNLTVYKLLSPFGEFKYSRTQSLAILLAGLPWFDTLEFEKHGFSHSWEELKPISGYSKDFLSTLSKLCEMEAQLTELGVLYWNFGTEHTNYLLTLDGNLRVCEFGQESFSSIRNSSFSKIENCWRSPVNRIDDAFIRTQLLLHICEFSLGEVHAREMRTESWLSTRGVRRAQKWALQRLWGTTFQGLCPKIEELQVTEPDSWRLLGQLCLDYSVQFQENDLQESADIESVVLDSNMVEVRGYQSYNIRDAELEFLPHGNLWDTRDKGKIVDTVLSQITSSGQIQSMIDLGSNLGAYVFLSALKYRLKHCIGVDYNEDYVTTCNSIVTHLGLKNCRFRHGKFSQESDHADLTLALGLVHHLYQRTESFGSLDEIVDHLARTCRCWLLVEFPDESDNKASKWTRMPGRAQHSPYTRVVFEEALAASFASFEIAGTIGSTRHFYLCRKS